MLYNFQIKILKRSAHQNIKKNTPKQKTEAELKEALKMKEAEYQAARFVNFILNFKVLKMVEHTNIGALFVYDINDFLFILQKMIEIEFLERTMTKL